DPIPRVILIGSISIEVPIASKVGAAAVSSPIGVLELDTHSSTEADPSKSSLPPVFVAPMVLPFLCSDDSELGDEMPERHVSPAPHDAILTSGPCSALTARKSVRPLPSHHLALRYISHHLDCFTSGSSSNHSSSDHSSSRYFTSDHSSSGHSILGHFVSEHTQPVTTIADSSTPLRFVYPPSSIGDSSSESFTGPSQKRCRSLAATVTSYIHALRALVPSCADLLPPHKRFGDAILLKDSDEEDIDRHVDVRVDVEEEDKGEVESSDRGTMKVVVDVVIRIDIPDDMLMPDAAERLEHVEEVASLKRSNARLQGTLKMESARADWFWRRISFMESELRQIRGFRYYDRMRFKNIYNDDNENVGGNGNGNYGGNRDENGRGNGNRKEGENRNGNPNRNDRGAIPISCADRSLMSSAFSALLDVIPSTLDFSYVVELANGRVAEPILCLEATH
nr:hypothetical protein [Tanacetum cinerariifolium]